MNNKLMNAYKQIDEAVTELSKLFSDNMELSFVARDPENDECFLIVGNDNLHELSRVIKKYAEIKDNESKVTH